jgi:hypothetical protein
MQRERKDIYKLYIENGVHRSELAVINIKHDHHEVPSPVSRDGDFCWSYKYIQPPKPEQEDWFMNLIIRDLDRDLLGK